MHLRKFLSFFVGICCLLIATRLALANQADGVTLSIGDGSPAVSPSPCRVNQDVTVNFKVSLYSKDDQGHEIPAANVASQSFTISAGTDSTISAASASGFTATIAGDHHSVTLTKTGGNTVVNFGASATMQFSATGDKNVTMSGSVTFADSSSVGPESHTITVQVRTVSIKVERAPGWSASENAQGYAFEAKITVEGAGNLEIHQLIKSARSEKDWNGNAYTRAQILALPPYAGNDPVSEDTNGNWETDTGWDWQAITFVGGKWDSNDSQTLNIINEGVTVQNTATHAVHLATQDRTMKIEVRDATTHAILATHEWGSSWSNYKAEWKVGDQLTPPPHNSCAGTWKNTGSFTATGIEGVPWW